MTERKDCWTTSDDAILSEIVLRHMAERSTQLSAFEEAAERLSRTPAACGFRWNSEVRKRNVDAINEAKQQRINSTKKTRKLVAVSGIGTSNDEHMDDIIQAVSKYKNYIRKIEAELERLSEEHRVLQDEHELLKHKYIKEKPQEMLSDDYQALIRILSNARKMGLIREDGTGKATFKVDANGNLEQISS